MYVVGMVRGVDTLGRRLLVIAKEREEFIQLTSWGLYDSVLGNTLSAKRERIESREKKWFGLKLGN